VGAGQSLNMLMERWRCCGALGEILLLISSRVNIRSSTNGCRNIAIELWEEGNWANNCKNTISDPTIPKPVKTGEICDLDRKTAESIPPTKYTRQFTAFNRNTPWAKDITKIQRAMIKRTDIEAMAIPTPLATFQDQNKLPISKANMRNKRHERPRQNARPFRFRMSFVFKLAVVFFVGVVREEAPLALEEKAIALLSPDI
jgi:hypothetical protein